MLFIARDTGTHCLLNRGSLHPTIDVFYTPSKLQMLSKCAQGMQNRASEAFTSCFALRSCLKRDQHVPTALINPNSKVRHSAFQPHTFGIFGCKDAL